MSEQTEENTNETLNKSIVEQAVSYITEEVFAHAVGRAKEGEGLQRNHVNTIINSQMRVTMTAGVNDTIMKGKLREAEEQGFIKLDSEFNELVEQQASSGGHIMWMFRFTDEGKDQVVPGVKSELFSRLDAIRETVMTFDEPVQDDQSDEEE